MQTYNVASKRTYIDHFDIIVAAMPILFLESRANPIRYMVRESLDIETQLSYRDTRYYLKVLLYHTYIYIYICTYFICVIIPLLELSQSFLKYL